MSTNHIQMNRNSPIVLAERYWYGHNPTYCKLLAEAYLKAGRKLHIICPYPDEVATYLVSKDLEIAEVQFHKVDEFTGPLHGHPLKCFAAVELIRPIAAITRRLKAQSSAEPFLYINVADLLFDSPLALPIISKMVSVSWGGLYMQPVLRTHCSFPRWLTRLTIEFLRFVPKGRLKLATTLDGKFVPKMQSLLKVPVLKFPDVTDESAPNPNIPFAKAIRAFANGRKVIGVLGNLALWKGIEEFCEFAERMRDNVSICFVACGPVTGSSSEQELVKHRLESIARECKNLYLQFGRIEDGECYNSIMATLDLVWCVYPQHMHSSNNLTKAAMLRIPVVTSNHGLLSEAASRYRLGYTISALNDMQPSQLLTDALSAESSHAESDKYFNQNSNAFLTETVEKLLLVT